MLASPIVADPLRLLDICATSDGARGGDRARAWSTPAAHTARPTPVRVRGDLDRHADATRSTVIELPELRHRLRAAVGRRPTARSRTRSPHARTRRPGIGPDDLDLRRGLRPLDRARARLVREHRPLQARARPRSCCATATPTIGGRIPVNPSGGLACFGEAVPAQAHRPGVRGHLAAAGPGRRPPGRGRQAGPHRQPGPVRPRLVGPARPLTRPAPQFVSLSGC